MAKYRIVGDTYNGFEVQFKGWFFWHQCANKSYGIGVNTFSSEQEARDFAVLHSKRKFAIDLGELP